MECFFINWLIIPLLPVFFQVSLQEDIHLNYTKGEDVLKPNFEKNAYKPNSTIYWYIIPSSKRESSTIEMTIKYIDIDDDAGNFLLIGGSSAIGNKCDIFGGPPPLLLSGKLENKKLLVATDAACVALVIRSKSKRKEAEDFEIFYQRTGVPVPIEETEPPRYDLWDNAIPVCIKTPLNISEEEMKNKTVSTISTLAEQFNKDKNNRITIIRETDINILAYAKRKDDSFYLIFTITYPNDATKPLFNSNELKKIIYNVNDENYQFRECTEKFQDEIEMNIIYATVPFFLVFFLFLWWWRYNNLWNSRFKTKEEINNAMPITLNIEMYPSQMKNPIYQPESPTSILEHEQSGFSFSNVGFTQKEELQRTDSSSSWSPEQSAKNRKISRKKFVSFAVQQENEDEVDEDNSSHEVSKPITSNLQDTKL